VVGGQISKAAHLDVFRLEAADPQSAGISRLYIGKQISDRLSFNFATDLNIQEARQTVIAEYLLTDNVLLRASRSTNFESSISGLLRFQTR
jgi:hypothetical protein